MTDSLESTDSVLEEIKTAVDNYIHDSCFDLDYMDDDVLSGWEAEELSDWTQDYKYQHTTTIFKHVPSGRYFRVSQTRSGSYHTDFYYNLPKFEGEVVKVEKMVPTVVWEPLQ